MLYPHVQEWRAGVRGAVERALAHRGPKHLKTLALDCNTLDGLTRTYPDLVIWYRHHWPPQDQHLVQPDWWANHRADQVLSALDGSRCRRFVKRVNGYNEVLDTEWYRLFDTAYTERMRREGLQVVSYSFSVGQPANLADWVDYLPIAGDSLGLHQYHAPELWSTQPRHHDETLFRHELVRKVTGYRGWIDLGEFGIDHGVISPVLGGWRKSGISAERYGANLEWAAARLAAPKGRRVRAFVFNWGSRPEWESFECAGDGAIAETLARIGDRYADLPDEAPLIEDDGVGGGGGGGGGGAIVRPISGNRLVFGFKELYDGARDLTGEPLEGEWSVTREGEAEAILQTVRFERGMAYWNRTGNYVVYAGHGGRVIRVRAGKVTVLEP